MRDVPVRTNPLDAFSMSALFCMLGPESYRRERFASMNLRCHASVSAPKYGTTRKIVSPERSRNMPFYRWDEMKRKNLAKPSDSEGSIIIGEHVTLNRSVSRPGKLARPHTHDCEQIINVVEGTAWFRVGMRKNPSPQATSSIFPREPSTSSRTRAKANSSTFRSRTNQRAGPRLPRRWTSFSP